MRVQVGDVWHFEPSTRLLKKTINKGLVIAVNNDYKSCLIFTQVTELFPPHNEFGFIFRMLQYDLLYKIY